MQTKSKSTDPFIVERDRRYNIISEKALWQELRNEVKINDKPISDRVAKDCFKAKSFGELKGPRLRVWLQSKKLIEELEIESSQYESEE